MNILGVIPARYASSRLPGKPLADIEGKPMIQHVYERASMALDQVVVATDDQRIFDAVRSFGGQVVLTSEDHTTGTNRCLEAYSILEKDISVSIDVVINIQGDEPLLEPKVLEKLSSCFADTSVEMATLAIAVSNPKELFDENRVFVVWNDHHDALYFSRSPLPHIRGVDKKDWLDHYAFHKHLGLYAYTPNALQKFAAMPTGQLEKAESLEQNRWIEAGEKIRVEIVEHDSIAVDTPEDLEQIRSIVATQKK